jgi:hypothetical protein
MLYVVYQGALNSTYLFLLLDFKGVNSLSVTVQLLLIIGYW